MRPCGRLTISPCFFSSHCPIYLDHPISILLLCLTFVKQSSTWGNAKLKSSAGLLLDRRSMHTVIASGKGPAFAFPCLIVKVKLRKVWLQNCASNSSASGTELLVTDSCPSCDANHLNVPSSIFLQYFGSSLTLGRVNVTYQEVTNSHSGPAIWGLS